MLGLNPSETVVMLCNTAREKPQARPGIAATDFFA